MKNIWIIYWICIVVAVMFAILSAYKFGYNSGYMDGYNHKQRDTAYFKMGTSTEVEPALEIKRVKKL